MKPPISVEEIHEAVLERLSQDPVPSFSDDLLPIMLPFFEKHFKKHESQHSKDKFSRSYRTFGHIGLEMNKAPAIAIIDNTHAPLVGPRLELHLQKHGGIHKTRKQLGKVARYINTNELYDTFPVITATTFRPLSGLAEKITGMTPAVATYIPEGVSEAKVIKRAIKNAHRYYRKNNNIKKSKAQIDSLSMPTLDFVERWIRS